MNERKRTSRKRLIARIIVTWSILTLAGGIIAHLNSMGRIGFEQTVLRMFSVLAMIVCLELSKIETPKGKPITINLTIVFAFTGILLFFSETDAITVFVDEPFAGFYFNQYGNAIYNLSLFFFGIFLTVHTFSEKKLSKKYLVAITTSLAIGGSLYYPIICNPRYAYKTPEVQDFVSIESAKHGLAEKGIVDASSEIIAKRIVLPRWEGLEKTGELTYEESLRRVQEILPYTKGTNYLNLINSPLRSIALEMNLITIFVLIFLILLSIVIDPPQGAYIDKLTLVFLAYLVFETIHGYVVRDIVEWELFLKIDGIGKYVTTVLVLLLGFIELRRYMFLSEGFGRYYETVLIKNPRAITRWRDGVDNLILGQFFKRKSILRRFFQAEERAP